MHSPVSGHVASWAIVSHLLALVMMVVTMMVVTIVPGPERLRQRIRPERETKWKVRKVYLLTSLTRCILWWHCGKCGSRKISTGLARDSPEVIMIIIYLLRVLMVPFCGSSFSPAGSVYPRTLPLREWPVLSLPLFLKKIFSSIQNLGRGGKNISDAASDQKLSKLLKTIDFNLCQILWIKTNDLSQFQRKCSVSTPRRPRDSVSCGSYSCCPHFSIILVCIKFQSSF